MATDLHHDEIDELQRLLEGLPSLCRPLDVVAAEGYLCGVLVQPRRIATDEWLPWLLDVDGRSPAGDADDASLARLRTLFERRFAALNEALGDGGFDPLLPAPEDDEAPPVAAGDDAVAPPAEPDPAWDALPAWSKTIAPWSAGFEHALACFGDLDALDDEGVAEAVATVLRHLPADEATAEAEDAPPPVLPALDSLDGAIDELVEAVAWLWDATAERRYRVEAVRRAAPKVGRNDPCPCGSGRKYKQCHGA